MSVRFGSPHVIHHRGAASDAARFRFLEAGFLLAVVAIILRLGYLQIAQYGMYSLYAADQHEIAAKLLPTRGQILVRDRSDSSLHPLATNRVAWQVYAVPKDMKHPTTTAASLADILVLPETEILEKITKRPDDPYELLAKDAPASAVERLKSSSLEGVGIIQTTARLYPERGISGQLIGFVSETADGKKGQYGIEGSFEKVLAGTSGSFVGEKDAGGRRLSIGQTELREAVNGSDVILTIDRAVQFKACEIIQKAVERHSADGGSILVADPETGAIRAMCSYPDFDSSEFQNVKDISAMTNPALSLSYEPGSVFKAVTMAAGLDAGKITPKTTYNDTGAERIDDFTIKNSDGRAHGVQDMATALAESLNTATIFVQRSLGKDVFRNYIESFGFGKKSGIEIGPEANGNIQPLSKKGSIFAATASFGQGITITPMQLLMAYAALGNGGKLLEPHVVEEIVHADGRHERTKPRIISQPISSRTSRLITGMLVNVVENGHGKRAGVPGYWVAGKTGTAQIPNPKGPGYLKDTSIGSFAGYAPSNDPKFVMLVKIDRPRDVEWAESSAAPTFGEMAQFLMTYYQVPPERPIVEKRVPVLQPAMGSATSTTRPASP